MSLRRAIVLLVLAAVVLGAHEILLAVASHAHVAHALLSAGNGPPPAGPAALALALVVVRVIAILLVPGAVLAALAAIVAHLAVGPIQGDGAGSGTRSGAGISVADGTGTSIEGRGTA
ncbi:MAG TPA: hypothetical protein VIF62_26695 [Labilithrix sp.]